MEETWCCLRGAAEAVLEAVEVDDRGEVMIVGASDCARCFQVMVEDGLLWEWLGELF